MASGFGDSGKYQRTARAQRHVNSRKPPQPGKAELLDESIQHYRRLADHLLLNNKNQEAEQIYQALIDRHNVSCSSLYANLSVSMKRQKKYPEALEMLNRALELSPADVNNLSNKCNLLREMGDYQLALVAGEKALELQSDHLLAINNYGLALSDAKQYRKAIQVFLRGFSVNNSNADILKSLSKLYHIIGDIPSAHHFSRLALLCPDAGLDEKLNHSILSLSLGYADAALAMQKLILEQHGTSVSLLIHQSETYQALGQSEAAKQCLFVALELNQYSPPLHASLCRLVNYTKDRPDLFELLFTCIDVDALDEENLISLYDARAYVLHQRKEYDNAGQYLQKIINLKQGLSAASAQMYLEVCEQELAYIESKQSQPAYFTSSSESTRQHIFIVGMPRSGSTLTESVLSMNQDCINLGEVQFFSQALNTTLPSATRDDSNYCNNLYKEYLRLVEQHLQCMGRGSAHGPYTDKMLFNYIYTGKIVEAIPSARIIWCVRNPLDNILSILRAQFSSGNFYSFCPRATAEVLVAQRRTMDRYSQIYPYSIYQCDYDKIVANPEEQIHNLIAWLGWQWHDNYLHPEASDRVVLTASVNQVRKPIYRSSLEGWKNYRSLLAPAIEVLDKAGLSYGQN